MSTATSFRWLNAEKDPSVETLATYQLAPKTPRPFGVRCTSYSPTGKTKTNITAWYTADEAARIIREWQAFGLDVAAL